MAARSNSIILELRRSLDVAGKDDAEEFASVLNVVLGLSGELIEAVGRIRLFAEEHRLSGRPA